MNNIFINDSIDAGISNYLLIKQGKDYDKAKVKTRSVLERHKK